MQFRARMIQQFYTPKISYTETAQKKEKMEIKWSLWTRTNVKLVIRLSGGVATRMISIIKSSCRLRILKEQMKEKIGKTFQKWKAFI